MLDKSRKIVSCLKVDYENKKIMVLNPSSQFLIDARGLLLIEKKGMHYAEVYMCLEQYFAFICHLPQKTCRRYIENLLLLKKLFTTLHFTLVNKLSDQLNAA